MMISSVRRRVAKELRVKRARARRDGAGEPPWPLGARAVIQLLGHALSSALGLALLSIFGLGALVVLSYLLRRSWGIGAATTGLLTTLWQVQAGAVSLALALAVFVFGLLPQTRGRVTYREFLSRSGALPIVALGVVSMILDGLVLLGVGRQIAPSTPTANDGHGIAVTDAIILGLASVASIGVLFVLTIRAIDPATAQSAQLTYRANVLGDALRREIGEAAAIDFMEREFGGPRQMFYASTAIRGRNVEVHRSTPVVVYDLSPWRLNALRRYAKVRKLQQPVIHCWPGRRLRGGTGQVLLTIDPAAWPPVRWWARRCVKVRDVGPDRFLQALDALHTEALESIRADRPVDAVEGIQSTGDMLDAVWRAYRAHERRYSTATEQGYWLWLGRDRPVALSIIERLQSQARAAAISRDADLRRKAASLVRQAAQRAATFRAEASVAALMKTFEVAYSAVVDEVRESGATWPPADGAARRRINETITAPVSLLERDIRTLVLGALSVDYENAPQEAWRTSFTAARHLIEQVNVINEGMLSLLRRAVEVDDGPTIIQILARWRHVSFTASARTQIERMAAPAEVSSIGEFAALQTELTGALDDATRQLRAMHLRLLVTAVHLDGDGTLIHSSAIHPTSPQARNAAVENTLAELTPVEFWQTLPAALDQAREHDRQRSLRDNELSTLGVVFTGGTRPSSDLLEVIILALLMRPELIDGSAPSPELALTKGEAIRTAVRTALSRYLAWLNRYGVDEVAARQRAERIIAVISQKEEDARDGAAESVIHAPLNKQSRTRFESEAGARFNDFDLTGRLLSWSGSKPAYSADLPSSDTPSAEAVSAIPRELLTGENSDLSDAATSLGEMLAGHVMAAFLKVARDNTATQQTTIVDAQGAVLSACAKLQQPREPETRANAARVVVLIPFSTPLREALGLTATGRPSETPAQPPLTEQEELRQAALREFGLVGLEAQWQFAGLIGTTPVFQIGALNNEILIIDFANFVDFEPAHSNTAKHLEAVLTISEPEQKEAEQSVANYLAELAKQGGQPQAGSAEADRQAKTLIRDEMLRLVVRFAVYGHFSVREKSAAHLLSFKVS
ncbi:hypothetical protein [Actinospica robiniae]|uniref:hypothetical protein n=1 Tax=Actinospica robiniae TaxID=304901 RepID=UPI000559431F|nr:hypothetical protein [Actinospica robiniae]